MKSANDVNRSKQCDPNNVNKVPVVRHHDGGHRLLVRETACRIGATDHHEERNEATNDVDAVNSGRQVEEASVNGALKRQAMMQEFGVFERLAADKDRAHDKADDEPQAQTLHVTTSSRIDTELARHRRQHKDQRVCKRKWEVQCLRFLRPQIGHNAAHGEVRSKKRRKEHEFAR